MPRKELLILSSLLAFAASAAVKSSSFSPWADYAKTKAVYARSIAGIPPTGMSTINVPYMPKSPLFPKFVDPKMMISKKTDMLTNLFGGLGPVYPTGLKPVNPYLSSFNPEETAKEMPAQKDFDKDLYKRGIFGPKFGPFGPKFGSMPPFASDMTPDYGKEMFRRKRSIDSEETKPEVTNLIKDLGPPPPYPSSLPPISEEPEETDSRPVPKEYLPGMFGPVGPVVDPSMFIAKKYAFLDTLFKNIATSTPETTTVTEEPPKSTIVPPSFWLPSSVIPSPTEYTQKVSDFLDKLFDSLKLNQTSLKEGMDDEDMQARIARSVQDISSITAAKDTIVDTIMSELVNLKGDMMSTLNDMITYQKAAATLPKKAFKPFTSGLWPKPILDPTFPFQQRMMLLSQIFDMLTDLQRNVTVTVQQAIKASEAELPTTTFPSTEPESLPFNVTLLDAIKKRLSALDIPSTYSAPTSARFMRTLPKTSFWVANSEDESVVKRQTLDDTSGENEEDADRHDHRQFTRGVKMQMHQGYQSLPAGSVESVQAGGGSTPGHQGGGIKLLDTDKYGDYRKWADWTQYVQKDRQGHRHHHHNHH